MESTAVERAERPEATAAEPEEAERHEAERQDVELQETERQETGQESSGREEPSEFADSAESADSADSTESAEPTKSAEAESTEATPSGPAAAVTSNASDYDRNRALGIRVIAFIIALCVLVAGWAIAKTAGSSGASSTAGGKGHKPGASSPTPPRLVQQLAATVTIPGNAPAIPWPSVGQAAIEMDGYGSLGTSGRVSTPVPIASVTKTMTAHLILMHHPLAAGEAGPLITVSSTEAAAYATESKQGQSLVKVYAGERISERDALEALMLASADNIAKILARWDAGSVSAFVDDMNTTADKLGMTHTKYTDPSGLEPSTVSTAPDQVKLGQAAMQSAAFAAIVGEQSATVPVQGTIHNFNRLVGRNGVTGIKTGSTDQADGCLLFADTVTVGDRTETVIGAVLGQPLGTGDSFLDHTLSVASKLIAAAQATVAATTIAVPGNQVASLHRAGTASEMPLGVAAPVIVVGRPGQTYRVSVSGGPTAPVLEVTVLNAADSGSGSGSSSASGSSAVSGTFSVPLVRLLPRGALSAR